MSNKLILASDRGVFVVEHSGEADEIIQHSLQDTPATSVIGREGVILAGRGDGVFRSGDLGATWERASNGLERPHVRWMAYHPQVSDFELVGTEPAGIFISRDGGDTWRACPEVTELRERFGWYLPYSPESGCVRGFAHHGQRAYAAVEVGGALRSDDGGESWQLVPGSTGKPQSVPPPNVHPDVHSIYSHPDSADLVFAATGGGFYRSRDGGATWELLYRCYCRAAWIDSEDAAHMLLGPADSVDRGGRIEETRDGGESWQRASTGTEAPWRSHMVERFSQFGDELLAVLSNGELLASAVGGWEWRRILAEAGRVRAVTSMGE
jgi:photosystem II stability/assembly factor-like uncharacterized protein